jgi:uncharacterized protein YbgA (DUF1722 family)/uncharacterized protein YbbK (DUF523 family)
MSSKERPRIGVSACLLGESVRYNNSHTQDKWLTRELKKYIDLVPFCPEVEMGLGVPREEISLYYDEKKEFGLVTKKTGKDLTKKALSTYKSMNKKLYGEDLDGLILMRKSPSCGISNVKTISKDGEGPVKLMQGLFAKNLVEEFPAVPKIDSGRSKNLELREHFIKNVFAHYRFRNVEHNTASLQDFHKKYKYILMDHSQSALKKLGKIVANSDKRPPAEIHTEYKELFFKTLSRNASVKNRINTMMHIMGYFKKDLDSKDKKHVLDLLADYREGHVSYMAPRALFAYFVKKYDVSYLQDHYYFNPYPKELKLEKEL